MEFCVPASTVDMLSMNDSAMQATSYLSSNELSGVFSSLLSCFSSSSSVCDCPSRQPSSKEWADSTWRSVRGSRGTLGRDSASSGTCSDTSPSREYAAPHDHPPSKHMYVQAY